MLRRNPCEHTSYFLDHCLRMPLCCDYAFNYIDYGKLLFGRQRKTPCGCRSKVETSSGHVAVHINRLVRSSRLADQDSHSVSDTRTRSCRTRRGNRSGGWHTFNAKETSRVAYPLRVCKGWAALLGPNRPTGGPRTVCYHSGRITISRFDNGEARWRV